MFLKNLCTALFAMWLCLSATAQTCPVYQNLNLLLTEQHNRFYARVLSPIPSVFADSCIVCVEKQAGGYIGVGLTENGTILHWYTINGQCHMVHEKQVLKGEELRGVLMEGMKSGEIFDWAVKLLEQKMASDAAQRLKFKLGLIFVPQAEFKLSRKFTNGGYPIAGSREIQSGTFAPALHACFSIEYKNWGVIPFYTLNSNSIGLSPSVSFFGGKLGFYGVASKSLSDGYSGYLGVGVSTPVGGTKDNPLGFAFVEYGQVFTPGGQPNYRAFYVGAFVPLLADVKKLKRIF